MKKILTIGEILVEIVATTKGDGFLEAQPLIGPFPSGAPAIFIDQVAKLGCPCAIISRVGDDDFAQVNLSRLQRDGVDIRAIEIAEGECTGSAFVRYQEDGSRKFVFNIVQSAYGRLTLTEAAMACVRECQHLHLMGTALASEVVRPIALAVLKAVKAQGGTLSFDPNLRAELMHQAGMQEALKLVLNETDIFLPSGEELYLFTKTKNKETAIAELLDRGVKHIVLKRGVQGASYFSEAQTVHIAPIPVIERDPTGAGDSFGGAFISLFINGATAEEALRYANAAGARATTFLGPMEGTSSRAELEQVMSG